MAVVRCLCCCGGGCGTGAGAGVIAVAVDVLASEPRLTRAVLRGVGNRRSRSVSEVVVRDLARGFG